MSNTPNVFKSVQASASGDTAVWTPTTGKKFRLLKYQIVVPTNCTLASRAVEVIKLRDGTTDLLLTHDVFLGQTAPVETAAAPPPTLYNSGWVDLGDGILSAAANNVLNVNLGTALAAGNVRVNVAGVEE